jgi:SAM-dependent MidA family methyltransferase
LQNRSPSPALPPLLPAEEAIHQALCAIIHQEIAEAGGFLPFSRFEERALYTPGLGYYSGTATKFGAAGDFVTAPEISPFFADCLAGFLAPRMAKEGLPHILELGGGTGAFAARLLRTLAGIHSPPTGYQLLEVSGDLRARQQEAIATLPPTLRERVSWLDTLPEGDFEGILFANEVLDALPVDCFAVRAEGLMERGVVTVGDGFGWSERPAGRALGTAVANLDIDLAVGYGSEICLLLPAWLAALSAAMARGAVVLIDYGYPRPEYYHAERSGGTLVCHCHHRATFDPFTRVGVQDLSAFVDFTAVAEAAVGAGFAVAGYTTQAQFLLHAVSQHPEAMLPTGQTAADIAYRAEAKRLLLPGEMGERFKVILLTKGITPESFDLGDFDQLHRL